jgi:ABC-type lipoprotein release transport system permease subunit
MLVLTDLRRNWPRTLILILAIASSVALSFDLISLSYGIRESTGSALDRVSADLYILPEGLNPLFRDLQRFDQGGSVMEEISTSPFALDGMAPRLKGSLFISGSNGDVTEVLATGVDPGPESTFAQYRVGSGSWFVKQGDPVRDAFRSSGGADDEDLSLEVIVTESLADRLGISVGDIIGIGPTPDALHGAYRIIGTCTDVLSSGSEEMVLRLGEMQYFKGVLHSDSMTEILVRMRDGEDAQGLVDWSGSSSFRFKDIVDVLTKDAFLGEIFQFTDTIAAFSALTIAITVTVAVSFASTILMISSRQRMKELSVLRAIGRTRMGIFRQVVFESLLLSCLGGILGTGIGWAVIAALNPITSRAVSGLPEGFEPFAVHPLIILCAITLAAIIGVFASLIPAVTSSVRTPVSSLRGDP